MESDKKLDNRSAETHNPTESTIGRLQRNPVMSRFRQKLHGGSIDTDVISLGTIGFLQLSTRKGVNRNSRIMAWDNQRIFGPAPETTSPAENGDLEAE